MKVNDGIFQDTTETPVVNEWAETVKLGKEGIAAAICSKPEPNSRLSKSSWCPPQVSS